MTNRIQEKWDLFQTFALPVDIPDHLRALFKKAFFAGSGGMLDIYANACETLEDESEVIEVLKQSGKEILAVATQLNSNEQPTNFKQISATASDWILISPGGNTMWNGPALELLHTLIRACFGLSADEEIMVEVGKLEGAGKNEATG